MIHKLSKIQESDNSWSNLHITGITTEEHDQWLWEVYLHHGEVKRILCSRRSRAMYGGKEAQWRSSEGFTPPEVKTYVQSLAASIGQLYLPVEVETDLATDVS